MDTKYILENGFDLGVYANKLTTEINSRWGFSACLINSSQIEVVKSSFTYVVDIVCTENVMLLKVHEKIDSAIVNMLTGMALTALGGALGVNNSYGNVGRTLKKNRIKNKLNEIVNLYTREYLKR